jgi:inorganic pyrophosphatase
MNIIELEKLAKDELKSNMEDLEVAPEDILTMIELLREMGEALEKIARVNAMDYEYQKWAKEALAKYREMTK